MSLGAPLLSSLDARVEAALFAAGRPVTESELAALLPRGADVAGTLARVAAFWKGRGISVAKTADGWTMQGDASLLPEETRLSNRRLSPAAIATLAVIAMHQPVSVPQIEKVRGVKLARGIVDSLKDAGLVAELGRRQGTGQAVPLVVTEKFLERFDLESLSDLPTSEEVFALDLIDPEADRATAKG